MTNKTTVRTIVAAVIVVALAAMLIISQDGNISFIRKVTGTPAPKITKTIPLTPIPAPPTKTPTAIVIPTDTGVPTPGDTPATPIPPVSVVAYPDAPLCPDHGDEHDTSYFHNLWDSTRGCHYDHEHGQNPFAPGVGDAFPELDLYTLLGGVGISHTNPSSPMENTHKHGGHKWQVSTSAPHGCAVGFEGSTVAVDAYAIQYHAFGPQSIEFEARNHSTASMLRQCQPGAPADKGYVYTVQLQEYGERCLPYQGQTLQYPDNFEPQWNCAFGPYFTTEGVPLVRSSIAQYFQMNLNNLSIWTSKNTGSGARPPGSTLFTLLFRLRDAYQTLDTDDLTHPFTWLWLCSGDAGATYAPAGCRYNNSTTTIHEIAGVIPASWDGLAGFDLDPRPGRVTADGYTTRFGVLNPACTEPGLDCHPIKLVSAFVGKYGSELSAAKVSNPTRVDTPERDLYFCSGVLCVEGAPGAAPSGWIGPNN